MRKFAVLALLAASVAAQDEAKPEPEPKPPRKDVVVELDVEIGFDVNELEKAVEELRSKDPETKRAALKRLHEILNRGAATNWSPMGKGVHVQTLRLLVPDAGQSGEEIQGTWQKGGRIFRYTLRSDGKGVYSLEAKPAAAAKGERTTSAKDTIQDKGTLAELRKRHEFLRHGSMVLDLGGRDGSFGLSTSIPRLSGVFARRPVVGVTVRPASDELRHHLELPIGAGLVVTSVMPESRAAKVGLRRFDIVVRVGEDLVDEAKQLTQLTKPDVKVEIIRRGKKKTLATPAAAEK